MARSSVLNSLAANEGQRPNLAAQLEAALSPAQRALIRLVAEEAARLGLPLYVVGGVVRDLLLERPIKDLDLVVEGEAIRLGRKLAKALGGKLTAHKRFGTAKWELDRDKLSDHLGQPAGELPAHLDLISARRESYPEPGALPDVQLDGIEADQARRDFSANTLALRLDGERYGELLDPWGGLEDLRQSRLRALHAQSFVDDPTRILRILRYAARLGFEIEAKTLDWLYKALPGLGRISVDRLRHELDAVLLEDEGRATLQLAQEHSVLPAIHPALSFDAAAAASLAKLPEGPAPAARGLEPPLVPELAYLLWLQHLPAADAISIAKMLKLPQSTQSALRALFDLKDELPGLAGLRPSQVVKRLETIPAMALYAAFLDRAAPKEKALLERFVGEWRAVKPGVDGNTLKARGLPPGPAYTRILDALRAAWLDGEISSTAQEAALLDRLISEDDG